MNPIPDILCEVFLLSPKNGGLGIINPTETADMIYEFSLLINSSLIDAIVENKIASFFEIYILP